MLERLIHNHHYLAIFIGSILQGEVSVLLAGLLVYKGHVSFPLAATSAALGALAGDLFYYGIGRLTGLALVNRFAFRARSIFKAQNLLHRCGAGSIFVVRYIQGVRAFNALLLGSVGMRSGRFVLLTLASCLLWAGLGCGVGYAVADPRHFSTLIPLLKSYQAPLLAGIVLLGLAQAAMLWLRHNNNKNSIIRSSF